MSEREAAFSFIALVLVGLLCLIGWGVYNTHMKYITFQKILEQGHDPIRAACASGVSYSSEGICQRVQP